MGRAWCSTATVSSCNANNSNQRSCSTVQANETAAWLALTQAGVCGKERQQQICWQAVATVAAGCRAVANGSRIDGKPLITGCRDCKDWKTLNISTKHHISRGSWAMFDGRCGRLTLEGAEAARGEYTSLGCKLSVSCCAACGCCCCCCCCW